MTAVRERGPRTPPRFVVRTFWFLHRAAYRLTGGGFGLSRPVAGSKFGMLRLTTIGRRSGQSRVAIIGYYPGWGDDIDGLATRRPMDTAVVVLEPRTEGRVAA
jgi:hypothetical protein